MDIIENLIGASYSLPAQGDWTDPPNNVCTQAAHEIKQLRAEVEEKHRLNMEYANEVLRLRAKVEALCKMLLQAADEVHDLGYDGSHYREAALAMGEDENAE